MGKLQYPMNKQIDLFPFIMKQVSHGETSTIDSWFPGFSLEPSTTLLVDQMHHTRAVFGFDNTHLKADHDVNGITKTRQFFASKGRPLEKQSTAFPKHKGVLTGNHARFFDFLTKANFILVQAEDGHLVVGIKTNLVTLIRKVFPATPKSSLGLKIVWFHYCSTFSALVCTG